MRSVAFFSRSAFVTWLAASDPKVSPASISTMSCTRTSFRICKPIQAWFHAIPGRCGSKRKRRASLC
jgi:hypothetical protein